MNPQTDFKTNYPNIGANAMLLAHHFSNHRKWIHCPKCIGGNMYLEITGEYICLQCGCAYSPDLVTERKPSAVKVQGELVHLS